MLCGEDGTQSGKEIRRGRRRRPLEPSSDRMHPDVKIMRSLADYRILASRMPVDSVRHLDIRDDRELYGDPNPNIAWL